MTRSMVFWHSVKIYLYYRLCQFLKSQKLKKFPKKYLTILALFLGAIIYKLASKIVDVILCKFYNMRTLSSFDDFFLVDDRKCVLSGVFRFDQFEFDKMSQHIKKNFAQTINGAASRLVQIFGQNYWMNLS